MRDPINARTHSDLARACDEALLAGMPLTLRTHVHKLVGLGWNKRRILALVRSAGMPRQSMAYLAVQAAIDEAKGLAR